LNGSIGSDVLRLTGCDANAKIQNVYEVRQAEHHFDIVSDKHH
jgi:hypothetical protein